MENNEDVILSVTLVYMDYESHCYGLSKKNQNCKEQWFYIESNSETNIKIL